jgi:hypothetical protein
VVLLFVQFSRSAIDRYLIAFEKAPSNNRDLGRHRLRLQYLAEVRGLVVACASLVFAVSGVIALFVGQR